MKYSPRFRRKFRRLERRIGKQKAIVAIARTIVVDMYFMLVRNKTYEERKGGKPVGELGH
ncbi:MAG: hypothetical protein QMD85_05155 [Candidatus Aenigmarchaeota archaeon]|nr:hypothetical protein [Candidatus Aenigmarchaeota archaeon]MDI6722934.1 hypothetical protein [Candidatus Aenigmarchaeota archaeon]